MGAVPSNVYGNYKLKKVQSQIKLKTDNLLTKIVVSFLAERVGFEPTVRY